MIPVAALAFPPSRLSVDFCSACLPVPAEAVPSASRDRQSPRSGGLASTAGRRRLAARRTGPLPPAPGRRARITCIVPRPARGVSMRRPRSHGTARRRDVHARLTIRLVHVRRTSRRSSPCRYLYSSAAEMSESPLLGRATRPGCTGCNSTLMATMYAGVTSLRARRRSLQPA